MALIRNVVIPASYSSFMEKISAVVPISVSFWPRRSVDLQEFYTLFSHEPHVTTTTPLLTIIIILIEWLRATITVVPFRVKFSSMSESTQTSQADLCHVKRCSCVVFSLKDLTNRHESLPPPPPPPHPPSVMLCSTGCPYLVYPNSAFFQEGGAMRWGENCRPLCEVSSSCF